MRSWSAGERGGPYSLNRSLGTFKGELASGAIEDSSGSHTPVFSDALVGGEEASVCR